ncbi:MAG: hypothetical protein LBU41_01375 [Clostridiales Family XIII bacterium]|jgi:positive regulator of sigma E activity|nr:hypothetical protein [Clostridiales Family XIII bacterium]
MVFTEEAIKRLDQDKKIKLKYVRKGTWGNNSLMYIPPLLTFFGIAWSVFSVTNIINGESPTVWVVNILCAVVLIAVAYLLYRFMQKLVDKRNEKKIESVPVCLARITIGNEDYRVFHAFFTTGQKRYDREWLNQLAEKIWNLEESEPDEEVRETVARIFTPKLLAEEFIDAQQLPLSFTEGEPVWQILRIYGKEELSSIEENGGFFPVLFFNPAAVVSIEESDIQ